MEPASAKDLVEMTCVMIPLQETNLLLPNICVAEILPWRRVSSIEEAPKWCLGMLEWRGEVIPVVRFERMDNTSVDDAEEGRSAQQHRGRLQPGLLLTEDAHQDENGGHGEERGQVAHLGAASQAFVVGHAQIVGCALGNRQPGEGLQQEDEARRCDQDAERCRHFDIQSAGLAPANTRSWKRRIPSSQRSTSDALRRTYSATSG